MPELVFELGCEELPAHAVRKAYRQLEDEIVRRLGEAGLPHGPSQSLGTPRRLIVVIPNLAPRQEDRIDERRGPSLSAAFDADGKPTRALEGFCRGAGVPLDAIVPRDGYAWARVRVEGKPTADLLKTLLPEAVRALTFDKAMRWGASRMRFVRPIRWMVAVFDGQPVPAQIESVTADRFSRGHRFFNPEPFPVASFEDLLSGLRQRCVEPDAAVREVRIREGAIQVASGAPELSDALVEENVFLTEWPEAHEGEFAPEFLALPEPVLITAMAKHERFFPVRDTGGRVTNRFVAIRNGGDEATVREGNAWVLGARFNDAKFFFDEDARVSLREFLDRTAGIVFHERLGTVRERADRLARLAATVAETTGTNAELARQAGLFAKADLSTGLVSELASLQGVVGGEYALREGFPEPVCQAIAWHYDLHENHRPDTDAGCVGLCLLVADQLDKLAGYLSVGLVPSGSSDPYALRRSATLLIHAVGRWPALEPGYYALFQAALAAFTNPKGDPLAELVSLFVSRYEVLMPNVAHDVLAAALRQDNPAEVLAPARVRFRTECLTLAKQDIALVQAATRPLNIVAAAEMKGLTIPDPSWLLAGESRLLASPEAEALAMAARDAARQADQAESPADLVAALSSLRAPIDSFFDSTMVMVEDVEVRDARLSLLSGIRSILLRAGDFSRLIVG